MWEGEAEAALRSHLLEHFREVQQIMQAGRGKRSRGRKKGMSPPSPHFACIFSLLLPLLPSKRGVMERNGKGKRKARLNCGRGRKEGGQGKHGKRGPTDPCTLHPIADMGAFSIFRKLSSLVFFASSARGRERERERAERE